MSQSFTLMIGIPVPTSPNTCRAQTSSEDPCDSSWILISAAREYAQTRAADCGRDGYVDASSSTWSDFRPIHSARGPASHALLEKREYLVHDHRHGADHDQP